MKDKDNPCKGCQHHRITSYSEYPGGKVWTEESCALDKDRIDCIIEQQKIAEEMAMYEQDLKFMEMTGDLDRLNEEW